MTKERRSFDGFRKSRRNRKCNFCKKGIAKGQRYYRVLRPDAADVKALGGRETIPAGGYCDEQCAGQALFRQ